MRYFVALTGEKMDFVINFCAKVLCPQPVLLTFYIIVDKINVHACPNANATR